MRTDLESLRKLALDTIKSAAIRPGESIPQWKNTTGFTLRLPGGNKGYPSFWVRDAAMMLGADIISADEVEGWIRLITSTQPGPEGIHLKNGLFVPGYSIPDHINGNSRAVWYPGTCEDGEDQGDGTFGFLPPADDAFFFIQMVREHVRLTQTSDLLTIKVKTGWGERTVLEVCDKTFDSVAVDPETELVICSSESGKTRVDWGFCDTVSKTGLALMPSLLRYQAALDMAHLHKMIEDRDTAKRYQKIAARLRESVERTFFGETAPGEGLLLSATGLGRKFDIWASSYAVTIGVLSREKENTVAKGLLSLYKKGGILRDGQVRTLPLDGELGGYWEKCVAQPGTYQNGAFWGTQSGWFIVALSKVDKDAAAEVLHALVTGIVANHDKGAPWECINPDLNHYQNPLYCATVALPYTVIVRTGIYKQ